MTGWSAKCFDLKAKNICSKIYQITPNRRQNKAKGWIRQKGQSQNWYFKKTKHAKFSKKRTFLTFHAHVRVHSAYQWLRNVHFPENFTCLVFLKQPFWDSPFYLITSEATPGWNRYNFYDISPVFWLAWCQQGCHFALVIKIKT